MRRRTRIVLCLSLALLALGITLYPLVSNYTAEVNRSMIETQYEKAIEQMDDSELVSARIDAERYNATLLAVTDEPYTREALQQASERYDELLNIRGDGIMGYLEIPKLGVELPVFHGTEDQTLDRGLGHLLGSSLPVGGSGTHCIITGHSGLSGQKLFSDLNLLQEDDVFFLRVLGQTLAYRVTDIYTVLPEETGLLAIDAGRDLCTLVTCTPYGVNSHRLLIRGERTEYEEAVSEIEDAEFTPLEESTWSDEYRRGLIYGGAAVAGIGVCCGIWIVVKRLRRKAGGRHEAT